MLDDTMAKKVATICNTRGDKIKDSTAKTPRAGKPRPHANWTIRQIGARPAVLERVIAGSLSFSVIQLRRLWQLQNFARSAIETVPDSLPFYRSGVATRGERVRFVKLVTLAALEIPPHRAWPERQSTND